MREIIKFLRNLPCKLLVKETRSLKSSAGWKFKYVEIEVTGRCNLRCSYCLRANPEYRKNFSNDIDFHGLMNLLPQLKDKTHELFLWGVGEPLLYENLDQVIKVAKKYVPRVCVTSNGILLTQPVADRLAKSELDQLNISLDGADSDSNELRNIDIEKVLDNLAYFSRVSRTRIDFWTVVTRKNLKKLPELARLKERIPTLHKLHFQMFVDFLTSDNHDPRDAIGDLSIAPRELSDMKTDVIRVCKKYGLDTDVEELKLEGTPGAYCVLPFNTLNINHKGYVTPCCMMFDLSLDNVFEMGFHKAITGPRITEFREEIQKGHYLPLCERACRYKCRNPKKEWVERTEYYRQL